MKEGGKNREGRGGKEGGRGRMGRRRVEVEGRSTWAPLEASSGSAPGFSRCLYLVILQDSVFDDLHCVHEKSNPLDNVR